MTTKKKRTRLEYILLGCAGPFAALLILVAAPVLFALYWCGRFWAIVPIVREMFDEDPPAPTPSSALPELPR